MSDIEENDEIVDPVGPPEFDSGELHKTIHLSGLYENWFLDYASYVILERAVPEVNDGLKPVHRRILHSMKDLDDGRYNKVANIIGHTMKYHPHGDASIGDALVQLGQKDLLIDTQGNWGNILTGDSAAAPRYIEARLSKFALDVVFNSKTTTWKTTYDGRNREPVNLPVKFPLLLAQGVEGIAVGLASKILPHNFNELIDASISILKDEDYNIYPDFSTGGMADFTRYNKGLRGGKARIRARISQRDKRTLVITEIPFGTTTGSLIDTIIAANDKGKIKIKKIDDNTAENVEVIIHLAAGVSPDQTIDALYAFTNCEVSISPNSCVIVNGKPAFIDVNQILEINTDQTVDLLRRELEIKKNELLEQLLFSSLEKIFIEKRIYRDIEECRTWKSVIETIDKGLEPYKKRFYREITTDDIVKLTEIRIKRISKYNTLKANEVIKNLKIELDEVENHLEHLIDYAINYYIQIKKKYGGAYERKTEVRNFDTIEATMVAAASRKLYVNRDDGFAGTALRKDEYVCECSDIDDIITFRKDGTSLVTKVSEKVFVGENIIHIDVFKKNDDRTIYNMVYQDGKRGNIYIKRFPVKGITRDKEYDLTKGKPYSRVLYFTANPNGEAEVIKVFLRPRPKMKKLSFEFDFSELAIKGRKSIGNILTKKAVKKIDQREEGISTLGAIDIWYDDTVRRLNSDQRGEYLGAFKSDDKIIAVTQSGYYMFHNYDLSAHFEEDMILIKKFDPEMIITVVYLDGETHNPYIKRFHPEYSNKRIRFIGDHPKSEFLFYSIDHLPQLEIHFEESPRRKTDREVINIEEFIGLKSYKARGKRITTSAYLKLQLMEPLPYEAPENDLKEVEEVEEVQDVQEGEEEKEKTSPEGTKYKKPRATPGEKGEKEKGKTSPEGAKQRKPRATPGEKGEEEKEIEKTDQDDPQMTLEF